MSSVYDFFNKIGSKIRRDGYLAENAEADVADAMREAISKVEADYSIPVLKAYNFAQAKFIQDNFSPPDAYIPWAPLWGEIWNKKFAGTAWDRSKKVNNVK